MTIKYLILLFYNSPKGLADRLLSFTTAVTLTLVEETVRGSGNSNLFAQGLLVIHLQYRIKEKLYWFVKLGDCICACLFERGKWC